MNATAIKLVVKLSHDDCPESPCDTDGWKCYSFSNRHSNFKHPDEFEDDEELERKLKVGLAFPLAYFEHGQCVWSLSHEGPQCRWDSVQHAGFIIWEQDESDLGPETFEDRRGDARTFIKRFTEWCNGEVYGYYMQAFRVCASCGQDEELSDEEAGLDLPSCTGFYPGDVEYMVEHMKESIEGDWKDYEVTFEEQHPYGLAEKCEELWKESDK